MKLKERVKTCFPASFSSIIILFALLHVSCSVFIPDSNFEDLKSQDYEVFFQHPDWQQISPDQSDMAYANRHSGSILMLNSLCKKYQKSNLLSSAFNLLTGIRNLEVTSQSETRFRNRVASNIEATGQLDGVKVLLKLFSFRKNRCTYDFVLITSYKKEFSSSDLEGFQKLLSSIRFSEEED